MGSHRRILRLFIALALLLFSVFAPSALGASEESRQTLDVFSPDGKRIGRVVIDRHTGRVDLYDTMSRRTGYGTLHPDGALDLFDRNGQRLQSGGIKRRP